MKCIIVGAGPAGLSAGIQFLLETKKKKHQDECIIIEKELIPEKACGGLITPKSEALLSELGVSDQILKKCDKISVSYKKVKFSYTTSEHFYTCHREKLIYELRERFISLGGQIIYDEFVKISEDYQIKCKKNYYNYDHLILANGYQNEFSDVTKYLNSPRERAFGVSTVVSAEVKMFQDNLIKIWFVKKLKGYCWCFPIPGEKMNIGFAGKIKRYPHSDYLSIKQEFDKYLKLNIQEYKGKVLPIDEFRNIKKSKKELRNNVYRIGEAGGYFDSLTGEGIYFALFTGILTAKYITKSINDKEYRNAIKIIYKICSGSTFTRKLLFENRIILPCLLHLAKLISKMDKHLTGKLILRYEYNYYSAFLSPFFCYTNTSYPYNVQKHLNSLINIGEGNEMSQNNLNEQYELNREGTLVSQAGLITAVFSFSTTALFSVWDLVLSELDRIPDYLVHLSIGIITFFLLLSMLFAVCALSKIINTRDKEDLSVKKIKENNNKMVSNIQISIGFFKIALVFVFVFAILVGGWYYLPFLQKNFFQVS